MLFLLSEGVVGFVGFVGLLSSLCLTIVIVYVLVLPFSATTFILKVFVPILKLLFPISPVIVAFESSLVALILTDVFFVVKLYEVVFLLNDILPISTERDDKLLFVLLLSGLFTFIVYVLVVPASLLTVILNVLLP